MDLRSKISLMIRGMALLALVSTLPACQKTKNSSVPKQPAGAHQPPRNPPPGTWVPPRNPPPVLPPGGGPVNPPGVVPPPRVTPPTTNPPPGSTVPPRVTPPTVVPPRPGTTTPPGTPPSGNNTNTPPRIVPLPPETPPTAPPPVTVTPPVYTPPATGAVPAAPAQPPIVAQPSTPAQPPAAIPVIVPGGGGQGAPIQVGTGQTGIRGDKPEIIGGLRVVTPIQNSRVFSTCRGTNCAPPEQVFVPVHKCPNGACVVTEEVAPARPATPIAPAPERPVFTCPDIEFRKAPMTNKLDILLIVDTSDSMHQERMHIANQMSEFIMQLSRDVDYRIAMILSHGPHSDKARLGAPFKSNGSQFDQIVIKHDEVMVGIEREVRGQVPNASRESIDHLLRRKTAEEVAKVLSEKMHDGFDKARRARTLPADKSTAEGEAGLLNLYTALKDGVERDRLKQEGFLRDNAALAVIFVADENDVCYDYKKNNQTPRFARKDLYEKTEVLAFNDRLTCAGSVNGSRLTPENVFETVVRAKGDMPVILSGVMYLDNNIPRRGDKWNGDNEMGRGYLDLIELGNGRAGGLAKLTGGQPADLSKEDFGRVLAKIGDFTNFSMKYEHVIQLTGLRDANDIEPESIKIYLAENFGTASERRNLFNGANVKFIPGNDKTTGKLVISYDTMEEVYAKGLVREGHKVVVQYQTKSNLGPQRPAIADAVPVTSPRLIAPDTGAATASPGASAVLRDDGTPLAPVEVRSIPAAAAPSADGP